MHVAHVVATLAASLALTVGLAGATGVVAEPAATVDEPTYLPGQRNLLNLGERRRRRQRRRRERRRQEREQEQAWAPPGPQASPQGMHPWQPPENTPIDDRGDGDGIYEPPEYTPINEPPENTPINEPPENAPINAPINEPPANAPINEPPENAPINEPPEDGPINEPPEDTPTNDDDDDTDMTSGGGSDDPDGLTAEHNRMRAKHCVPALQWDSELATKAKEWANTICDGSLRHSSNGPENLAMCSGGSGCMTAAVALKGWYTDEESQYDYGNGGFSMVAGHFTQVVWKEAQKLGCGKCVQGSTETLVCNYDKGNMSGAFEENVPPPC